MAVATNTEVFEFMGTPTDQRTTQSTPITNLIAQMTQELEILLGRKVEPNTITEEVFYDGYNCEMCDEKLYLKGIYRDLYTISAIDEDGTALSEATGSSSNGYKLDARLGIINRIGARWLLGEMAYKISGKLGLVNSDDSVRDDIKQIVIEMTAAKSGLWKNNVTTADGTITTIRTKISDDTKDLIERYKLRDV